MLNSLKSASSIIVIIQLLTACYNGESKLIPRELNDAQTVEEGFRLDVVPKVDILFVVDDSGSMREAQVRLAENMSLFTQAMEKNKYLDYHIGVISTSFGGGYREKSGRLQGQPNFVTRSSLSGLRSLESSIIGLGLLGNGTESFFDPVFAAIDPEQNLNPGFMRSDAFFILIFITDTKDQSQVTTGFKVYDQLVQMKANDTERVLGYSVISYPKYFQDECRQDDKEPDNILDFMFYFSNAKNARIGGGSMSTTMDPSVNPKFYDLKNVFSLCDTNFGQKLANIGEDIRLRVSLKIPLPVRPVDGTIQLKYGEQLIDQRWWRYDFGTNSLVIDPNFEYDRNEAISTDQFFVIMDEADPEQLMGEP
jgi:hypothetical protein